MYFQPFSTTFPNYYHTMEEVQFVQCRKSKKLFALELQTFQIAGCNTYTGILQTVSDMSVISDLKAKYFLIIPVIPIPGWS